MRNLIKTATTVTMLVTSLIMLVSAVPGLAMAFGQMIPGIELRYAGPHAPDSNKVETSALQGSQIDQYARTAALEYDYTHTSDTDLSSPVISASYAGQIKL